MNWNCRALLCACLTSLLRLPQGVRAQVIVVDNASSDGAADLVTSEFPEVLLICNRNNHGFARASNQAARRAVGRYLFFLNNDTIVPPNTLARLLGYAEAHPDVGLIGPRMRDSHGRAQISYRRRPSLWALLHRTNLLRWTGLLKRTYRRYRREELSSEQPRPVDVLMGAAVLVRRDRFEAFGGWDERFTFGGEDIDLCTRIGRHHPVVYLPGVEITHLGRMSTRLHVAYTSAHVAVGMVRYLRKWGCSRFALLAYKLAVTLDAPLLLADKALQYTWRRAWGRRDEAQKSWLIVQGAWHFLKGGLALFWWA